MVSSPIISRVLMTRSPIRNLISGIRGLKNNVVLVIGDTQTGVDGIQPKNGIIRKKMDMRLYVRNEVDLFHVHFGVGMMVTIDISDTGPFV